MGSGQSPASTESYTLAFQSSAAQSYTFICAPKPVPYQLDAVIYYGPKNSIWFTKHLVYKVARYRLYLAPLLSQVQHNASLHRAALHFFKYLTR